MRKFIKFPSFTLIILCLCLFTSDSVNAAGVLSTTQDLNDKNKYYFVGNFYHDIWRNSANEWTSDEKPGQKKDIAFPYSFSFPNRKIKDVKVRAFNPNEDISVKMEASVLTGARQVYKNSRYGMTWESAEDRVSIEYKSSTPKFIADGTDTASFTVNVTDGVLTSKDYEDITHEGGSSLDTNVQERRYYFPSLLIIELEPEGGTAEIRHYTTTGQRLNGVGGFTDEIKDLKVGTNYSFRHTSGTVDYIYKGYKTSRV